MTYRRSPLRLGLVTLLVASGGAALTPPEPAPNGSDGDSGFVALRDAREPVLQRALERAVRDLGYQRLVERRKLAIAVAGITDEACPRMAAVNGNVMMYAASLPKIAILLAAFKRVDAGDLALDAELERDMSAMIRRSSNPAATRVLKRVGAEYVNQVLRDPELALYDREHGGGLWVGKEYGPAPAFRRDPLHGLSHGATAIQVARFFYLLERGRLVSPALTPKMKAMLGDPRISHKFVAGIGGVHPEARVWRKSGTWRDYHSDGALIEHGGKRYVAVALVHAPRGEQILRRLVVALDRLIFEVPPHCPGEAPAWGTPSAPGAPPA